MPSISILGALSCLGVTSSDAGVETVLAEGSGVETVFAEGLGVETVLAEGLGVEVVVGVDGLVGVGVGVLLVAESREVVVVLPTLLGVLATDGCPYPEETLELAVPGAFKDEVVVVEGIALLPLLSDDDGFAGIRDEDARGIVDLGVGMGFGAILF